MVRNFARGGAAISVLAQKWNARLEVVNVGTVQALGDLPGVLDARIAAGTANFVHEPAMSVEQLHDALTAGREAAAERASIGGARLFIGGEMGIGNTTSAAAVACSLLGLPAAQLAGPGTGLDAAGVARKALTIERGLARHRADRPLAALQRLGGFEIAALAGAYLRCAQLGVPALVDGFIATTARWSRPGTSRIWRLAVPCPPFRRTRPPPTAGRAGRATVARSGNAPGRGQRRGGGDADPARRRRPARPYGYFRRSRSLAVMNDFTTVDLLRHGEPAGGKNFAARWTIPQSAGMATDARGGRGLS